jgi:coiled-coil domain-containing protein 12
MEDPAARKARLKALREAAAGQGAADGGQDAAAAKADQEPEKPVLKFRNYNPKDEKRIEHEKVSSHPLFSRGAHDLGL